MQASNDAGGWLRGACDYAWRERFTLCTTRYVSSWASGSLHIYTLQRRLIVISTKELRRRERTLNEEMILHVDDKDPRPSTSATRRGYFSCRYEG